MSLQEVLQQRISSAQSLLQQAQDLCGGGRVEGGGKLLGRLRAELRFLRRVQSEGGGGEGVSPAQQQPDAPDGHRGVSAEHSAGDPRSLQVDVVSDGGLTWVKAVGRKAEALHSIWQGGGQYGEKSIISQARDFLSASQQQEVQYKHPHVVFAFYNGVSHAMAQQLGVMGVSVRGDIVAVNAMMGEEIEGEGEEPEGEEPEGEGEEPDEDGEEEPPSPIVAVNAMMEEGEEQPVGEGEGPNGGEESGEGEGPGEGEEPDEDPSPSRVQRGRVLARLSFPAQRLPLSCLRVNLDITTLISCVSSLSHGGCFFSFREGVLTEQAAQERLSPVLPQLRAFMEGKQLFACSAAVTDFRLILETLGGPGEKQRGEQLLRSLTLMEDQPSQRSLNLTLSHKVTQRSVSIFGTGDSLRAVTMTANGRFVRAAANQGVRYNVFMHQPRALTEGKEWRATPI
ncbi:UPF0415 protein C7orf25 [Dissostichus eleginoides]|uniref:UPF0415 protein C7orf25 n=1 Tax=Dissostichus eleginoides TaxID=100907 RepID=A0AAD9B256_DISEL|nr:UPF0415 protein C7orf25 [Dissostichus eleginoides]